MSFDYDSKLIDLIGGCKCGMKKGSKIVGGQDTEANEYPWMAFIIMLGT